MNVDFSWLKKMFFQNHMQNITVLCVQAIASGCYVASTNCAYLSLQYFNCCFKGIINFLINQITIWMEIQSFQHFNRNSSPMVNNQLSVTFVLYFTALALSAL